MYLISSFAIANANEIYTCAVGTRRSREGTSQQRVLSAPNVDCPRNIVPLSVRRQRVDPFNAPRSTVPGCGNTSTVFHMRPDYGRPLE